LTLETGTPSSPYRARVGAQRQWWRADAIRQRAVRLL